MVLRWFEAVEQAVTVSDGVDDAPVVKRIISAHFESFGLFKGQTSDDIDIDIEISRSLGCGVDSVSAAEKSADQGFAGVSRAIGNADSFLLRHGFLRITLEGRWYL